MQCGTTDVVPRWPSFPDLSTLDTLALLISFEGIDGSGKSTQARLLSQSLRKLGYSVVEVREPGGTSLGEDVRGLVLDPSSVIAPLAELFLFTAARAQLTTDVIVPALNVGRVVVADRFLDSTIAYQGSGRGLASTSDMMDLQRLATSDVEPARTFFVDVPIEVAFQRRKRTADRMESSGHDFYRRVMSGYRELDATLDRFVRLDGTLPVEDLAAVVLADVVRTLTAGEA